MPVLARLLPFTRLALSIGLACAGATAMASEGGRPTTAASEAALSWPAARVGAPAAWSFGSSGAGVVVAILDSGVRATHLEFAGRLLPGWDATGSGFPITSDPLGHGTHVAGLIAAARDGVGIAGVAPGASILPVRVFTDGVASDAVLSAGVRWAAARSGILNLSLASATPIAGPAIREAVARGALVVVAAGNRGAANPEWPARYAREAWAHGPSVAGAVIAVGAVDADNRITVFSDRAGDTAPWFLVAPGAAVVSASAQGDAAYGRQSGTSMAAPAVSGAAALLQSRWPRLGGREVAAILLATARDLGAPGTDPIYGRGLLDVDAAMRPVGAMTAMGPAGEQPLAATGLRTSAATVALAQATARAGLPAVVLDAYRRDFTADLSARIVAPLPMTVQHAFDGIDRRMERSERMTGGDLRLSLQPGESFSLTGRDAVGEYAFGAGARAREWFGVAAGLDVAALANPYAALAPRGALIGRGVSVGDTTLKAGVLGGSESATSGMGWTSVSATTTVLEATQRLVDGVSASATWTRSVERGSWLGAIGSGAFASSEPVRTDALQLGATVRFAAGWTLAGTRAWGRTPGHQGAGVIGTVGASQSDAASVALIRDDALRPGDTLSLSVSQPMRTRSGDAHAVVQTGFGADGSVLLGGTAFSLVPEGRERAAELAWRTPLGRDASVGAVLARRWQPNHDAQAAPDTLVAVRYRKVF
ncbi:MAG: hypothetical protein EHM87_18460 [Burkholderiales bacterium]|nr:MAG: hypothetical protein EHM87_18460 [Burkholderiales bacterium]